MLRYAITDRTRFPGDDAAREAALLRQFERLATMHLDFIQLREKDLEAGALASLARKLLEILHAHSPAPKLLINNRADVAIAAAADGVHLTAAEGSLTPADIRRLYASANLPEPVVSISCHTLHKAVDARKSSPNLILFGPVFEKVISNGSSSSPADIHISQGSGLNLLHLVCAAASPIPVLALGGVTPENAESCLQAGAAGIAAIRLFLD